MAIKLVPLARAYPGSGYDKGKRRAHHFAIAGMEFHRVCRLLLEHDKREHEWFVYVELPLMHQALELLAKSIATSLDEAFDPKKYRHDTLKIVAEYRDRSAVFDATAVDIKKTELLKGLTAAWSSVRYAEDFVGFDYDDWLLFDQLAEQFVDEYYAKSGMPRGTAPYAEWAGLRS